MQGKALFDKKKRPSQMEKGVSLFLFFRYHDSCYYVIMSLKYVIKTICLYVILSKKTHPSVLNICYEAHCYYVTMS